MERPLAALLRIAFASLTLAAVTVQLADLAARGVLDAVNFFSYFTIQSNVIGAVALLWTAAKWRTGRTTGLDLVRGGATVYLTVTFVVFALLLSGTDVDTAIPWVNTVLHGIFPIAVMVDWVLTRPVAVIRFRQSLVWLLYPIAWVGYTMARGPIAGWYPYPFLNPANGGLASVTGYIAAIFVFGLILCGVVSAVGRWRTGPLSPLTRASS